MLRALFVLGFVCSCAPVAASVPSSRVAPLSSLATSAREATPTAATASESRADDRREIAAQPPARASRLAPPFGSSGGVRRIDEPSETAPEAAREIVARAGERD